MKRAAAIIGPTPSFVRWTILKECPYRQLEDQNQTYSAFRQLRNLREVSLALIENRVQQNVCIHGTENRDTETARGFPLDEVMEFFGTAESVSEICGNCPANAARYRTANDTQTQWAGCYGWMQSQLESVNLIEIFNSLPASTVEGPGVTARETWHRVWQIQRWTAPELKMLDELLTQIPDNVYQLSPEFADLVDGVAACRQNDLVLETQLMPSSHSDGLAWTINGHCTACQSEEQPTTPQCQQCGGKGTWKPAAGRKVLGLRPYMVLKNIIGAQQTEELLQQFHQGR